jgi:hypothetical protein
VATPRAAPPVSRKNLNPFKRLPGDYALQGPGPAAPRLAPPLGASRSSLGGCA